MGATLLALPGRRDSGQATCCRTLLRPPMPSLQLQPTVVTSWESIVECIDTCIVIDLDRYVLLGFVHFSRVTWCSMASGRWMTFK